MSPEPIPPAPSHYFNDYAQVISPATSQRLEQALEDFEKTSSSQVLVAIYPKMPSDFVLEDYTIRVARAWRVGQQAKNNGAILFIFIHDRKMRIEVGYGLEGVLPDITAKRIIEDEIKPHFQRGDYDGGVTAGVNAIIKAVRGEYTGTGTTAAQHQQHGSLVFWFFVSLLGLFWIYTAMRRAASRGTVYRRDGRASSWDGWGGWSSGGWSGSGSGPSGGGGGGGFSGGGGSFGGGGASGSW